MKMRKQTSWFVRAFSALPVFRQERCSAFINLGMDKAGKYSVSLLKRMSLKQCSHQASCHSSTLAL